MILNGVLLALILFTGFHVYNLSQQEKLDSLKTLSEGAETSY